MLSNPLNKPISYYYILKEKITALFNDFSKVTRPVNDKIQIYIQVLWSPGFSLYQLFNITLLQPPLSKGIVNKSCAIRLMASLCLSTITAFHGYV